jgi:dipeptidyl aminopeptidase/acylaminoacyl peptidase
MKPRHLRRPRLALALVTSLVAGGCLGTSHDQGEAEPPPAPTAPAPTAPEPVAATPEPPAVEPDEAPAPQGPRLVTPDDYDRFESLRGGTLSENGEWFAYELARGDDSRELRVRSLIDDEAEELVQPWASRASFSKDGVWVAWSAGVSTKEAERLRKKKEPVHSDCVLRRLGTDEERELEGVARFAFDETGRYLAVLGYAPKGADGKGADLRLLDLTGGDELTLGNVGSFAWCEVAPVLAIAMKTGSDAGNGVQLVNVETGRLRNLDSSASEYSGLAWREESADLAVLRSVIEEEKEEEEEEEEQNEGEEAPAKPRPRKNDDAKKKETEYTVLAWLDALDEDAAPRILDPAAAGLEADKLISGGGGPRWSDDGRRLSVNLKQREPEEAAEEEAAEAADEERDPKKLDLPGLQIWHSKDVRIYPQQKSAGRFGSRDTLTAVWHLEEDRLVRVAEDPLNRTQLMEGWDHALERDTAPYPWGQMFGRPYHDLQVVDTTTGERRTLLEKTRHDYASAGGRYVLSFDGATYWADDLVEGTRTALTADLDTEFGNTEYDTPTDLRPPYGVAGWVEDDAAVLLRDRYDVWWVALDGSGGRRLTRGAEEQRIHRLLDLDREEPAHAPDEPWYFHTRGDWTEHQGYARLDPGADVARQLFELPKSVGGLVKAEEAEVYAYRAGARDDSPDWFVAGAELAEPRPVTATNDFLDEFHWTRAELIEWTSDAGVPLQGCLLYPADHDPAVPAPMIVYTYEKLSQQLHGWRGPSDTDYYNHVVWTQAGYFVLLPDIVYRPREPGPSALDAVRPAVAAVVATGLVDAERVGLIGHSWGGYQATYLPTRTDIFAAAVAGAPLTDFVSFMGQIHWSGGMPETGHWETGQGRMEVPYWEDPEAHRRSSPMEKVHEMETPLLMAFGDEDGTVDWDQGTTFYNYARRAGKQMVLLVYEGEGHGLRQDANRRDYQRRILEWFGHYLKGEPAPAWITDGVEVDDLEDERARLAAPKD